jgi:hypothetical protein
MKVLISYSMTNIADTTAEVAGINTGLQRAGSFDAQPGGEEEGEAPVVSRVKKKLREAQARPGPTTSKTKANAALGPAR